MNKKRPVKPHVEPDNRTSTEGSNAVLVEQFRALLRFRVSRGDSRTRHKIRNGAILAALADMLELASNHEKDNSGPITSSELDGIRADWEAQLFKDLR